MRFYSFLFSRMSDEGIHTRNTVVSAGDILEARKAAFTQELKDWTYVGFYRLPFNPTNRLSKVEFMRLLSMLPMVTPEQEILYAIQETTEPEENLTDATPCEDILDAREAGEGAALPTFNYRTPDVERLGPEGIVILGLAALIRHLREVQKAKLGEVPQSLGTFDIKIADVENFQFGIIDTAIYTKLDGMRHGLVLRRPIQ